MMNTTQNQVDTTISRLYQDARHDRLRVLRGAAKSIFGPMQPADFATAYLSISREQGEYLKQLIIEHDLQHIVEFGTSFGISTLFLAQGALATGGRVVTTELIATKAQQARENFTAAGVSDLIDVRIGDALETLKDHTEPIDLLLLDGWKDLYLPLFRLLAPNFHRGSFIYVDNADMAGSQRFLKAVAQDGRYRLDPYPGGKAVLIRLK